MGFTGSIYSPNSECGESTCTACNAHKTCVGPMISTHAESVAAGQCIQWQQKVEPNGDDPEAMANGVGATVQLLGVCFAMTESF